MPQADDANVRYAMRQLFGGAIEVFLPIDLIDSSDIRQIPDHQEVFLSPTTLTSVIFEINSYVNIAETEQAANDVITPATSNTPDLAAAAHHFTDVIAPPDTLTTPLPPARSVIMTRDSLNQFPAYVLAGTITTYETRRSGNHASAPPTSQPTSSLPESSLVHQLQLLVRLPQYATDLCVRINVPTKLVAGSGNNDVSSADQLDVEREEAYAVQLLHKIINTMEVHDFGLFGTEADNVHDPGW
ncbi:hypothetical protein B0A52_08344 [Exophiala mesophila]|uniref:Ran guanine nucleotide release factor n=1 Tax=Exophiala mesophila TaxID=212818 RepID=A0A438MTQ6_EXOME|nr:hypothetical protein B0A52_08344 [Exophiala mesophila]